MRRRAVGGKRISGFNLGASPDVIRNEADLGVCEWEDRHPHTEGKTCVGWRPVYAGRRADGAGWAWAVLALFVGVMLVLLFGR